MKYKKRSLKQRLLICQMAEAGNSPSQIYKLTGVSPTMVSTWCMAYQLYGKKGLEPIPYKLRSVEEKRELICEFQKKTVSLQRFCVEHKVSVPQFCRWMRDPIINDAHVFRTKQSSTINTLLMGRRKKQEPQTELEKLQAELEYLRAENALLKKVKALMVEKEARLRETGQKPSSH